MGRTGVILLCAILAHAGAARAEPAAAGLNTPRGIAREAAKITAIKAVCPAHVPIDVGFAQTLQAAILTDGIRGSGKAVFMQALREEQAAGRAAFGRAGTARWCRARQGQLERSYPDLFRR